MQANLINADFRGTDFSGANLSKADFTMADLRLATLYNTNLSYSNLLNAHLDGTDLVGSNLRGANLSSASLEDAKLLYADLVRANLSGASLIKADLENAIFGQTVLGGLNLFETKGLEKITHQSSSFISTETLRRFRGRIPEKFLRGCGLSDWEIESAKLYQSGLAPDQVTDITYKISQLRVGNPIQFYSCFISYSTKDQEFAQRLYDDLQNNGVRCWFAPEDVQGGKKLHEQIDFAIQKYDRLLLILSENSMNSEWVKTEIAKARRKEVKEKRRVLFPIRLVDYARIKEWECFDVDTGKDSAREIREYFIPDFSNWQEEKSYRPSFERLLKDLRARE